MEINKDLSPQAVLAFAKTIAANASNANLSDDQFRLMVINNLVVLNRRVSVREYQMSSMTDADIHELCGYNSPASLSIFTAGFRAAEVVYGITPDQSSL